jgi:hypothetical protein
MNGYSEKLDKIAESVLAGCVAVFTIWSMILFYIIYLGSTKGWFNPHTLKWVWISIPFAGTPFLVGRIAVEFLAGGDYNSAQAKEKKRDRWE